MSQPVRIAVTNDTYRSKQWALDTLRAESAWKFTAGTGATVAVVDTGVQSSHPDLSGKVLSGYDVLAKGTSAADQNGHGTHVAGIIAAIADNGRGIAGLARAARILPVRVLDAQGEGDTAGVAQRSPVASRWPTALPWPIRASRCAVSSPPRTIRIP